MKEKKRDTSRWFIILGMLIIAAGIALSAWISNHSKFSMYPGMIADAYRAEIYRLVLPGSREVNLTRIGAYGIYYENSLVASIAEHVKTPPSINCSLTSLSTGNTIEAVQDYVASNRYWSKKQGGGGVLIMSITVDKADKYTFACKYQDGKTEPKLAVGLGPNYFWEFIRVVGKIILPLLGGISILCGSTLTGIILIIVGAVKQLK